MTAKVVAARNISASTKWGVPESFVITAIGNSFHRTSAAGRTLNPLWGETFSYGVAPASAKTMFLTLTVEDKSASLLEEPIGQLSIPVAQIMQRQRWEGWFDLRAMNQSKAQSQGPPGSVHLILSWDNA